MATCPTYLTEQALHRWSVESGTGIHSATCRSQSATRRISVATTGGCLWHTGQQYVYPRTSFPVYNAHRSRSSTRMACQTASTVSADTSWDLGVPENRRVWRSPPDVDGPPSWWQSHFLCLKICSEYIGIIQEQLANLRKQNCLNWF